MGDTTLTPQEALDFAQDYGIASDLETLWQLCTGTDVNLLSDSLNCHKCSWVVGRSINSDKKLQYQFKQCTTVEEYFPSTRKYFEIVYHLSECTRCGTVF